MDSPRTIRYAVLADYQHLPPDDWWKERAASSDSWLDTEILPFISSVKMAQLIDQRVGIPLSYCKYACLRGQLELFTFFIDKGVKCTEENLKFAIIDDKKDIIDKILSMGVNGWTVDKDTINSAIRHKYPEIVRSLSLDHFDDDTLWNFVCTALASNQSSLAQYIVDKHKPLVTPMQQLEAQLSASIPTFNNEQWRIYSRLGDNGW